MKTFLLLLFSVAGLVASELSFPVASGVHEGYRVEATDRVRLVLPDGRAVDAVDPFMEPNIDWRPTGTIMCAWGPTYVAVFVPHPRVTDIFVFPLDGSAPLPREFPEWDRPAWYENATIIHDAPNGDWTGDSLPIKSVGILSGGAQETLPMSLRVADGSFYLRPE